MIKKLKSVTKTYIEEHKKLYEKGLPNKYMELFHQKMTGVRKSGIIYSYDQSELQEYCKCKNDPIYFIQKYCSLLNPNQGIVKPILYGFQKELIENYLNNRFNISLISRQMGFSYIISYLIIYLLTFELDKNFLLVNLKGQLNISLIDKIKMTYLHLPFFFKKGIKNWNLKQINFDDSSSITTSTYTKNFYFNRDIHLLYMENYSNSTTSKEFYENIIPTISSIKNSRIVIQGKFNGFNHFCELLHNSELPLNHPNKNVFKSTRIYWFDHPERDEEWAKNEKTKIGDEAFNREHNNQFFD